MLEFAEQTAVISRMLYATPNVRTLHRLVALDVPTPTWMRAPGEAPGSFALESAMDELAVAAGIDPVELRIRNDTDREPEGGLPFSSRSLVECLREGAAASAGPTAIPRPASRRDGRWLRRHRRGHLDLPGPQRPVHRGGDGPPGRHVPRRDHRRRHRHRRPHRARPQIAADELRTAPEQVELRIADSDFGPAMIAGGSMGTASWSWAVVKACRELREQLLDGARRGRHRRASTPPTTSRRRRSSPGTPSARSSPRCASTSDTGEVRVPRMVGVFAAGRIVNPTAARSQFLGGMTMGIGMALHEESIMDVEFGDYLNHDLAQYHVPVNADVPDIEVGWIDEHDEHLNPLGIKGIGEIGIVGTAAAIANAVWHATGVRHRDLPIRPDRVLTARG